MEVTDQDTHITARRRRGARPSYLAIAAIVLVAPAWLLEDGSSRVATQFDFTRSPQDYVVPAGICQIRIDVVGAAGGPGGTAGSPGAGARAIADFTVTPGEKLRVRVGGWGVEAAGSTPGVGGWNGGGAGGRATDVRGEAGAGGGGATDIRRGGDRLEHRILVGAGGSGGAGAAIGGPTGTGGGAGGDPNGQEGFAALGVVNPATGGKGGAPGVGGTPGRNADLSVTATAGTLGAGGNGAAGTASGGGGGGGGLYGGGGGGSSNSFSGGHGGGGSSFGPTEATFRTGVSAGFGRASISYDSETRC